MSQGASLATRIANIFSPSSSASAPQSQNTVPGLVDDGLSSVQQSFADISLGAAHLGADTMASEAIEEEEEARPPYIHVRYHASRTREGEVLIDGNRQ